MDEITAVAAAETINVLYNTEVSLIAKIPYAILKALEDKASEYTGEVKLDMSLGLEEQPISEEAQSILSIIYKDYWCNKEQQQEMNRIFVEKAKEYDEEQRQRFDPFKDAKQFTSNSENTKTIEKDISNSVNIETNQFEQKALMKLPKKWYVRIFDRIKRFFRKR